MSTKKKPPQVSAQESQASKPVAGKLGIIMSLLARPEGATIAQMVEATGWQPHSVRGAMASSLKKRHGLAIASVVEGGTRVYRSSAGGAA